MRGSGSHRAGFRRRRPLGFSLIEVIVATTLLAVVMIMLATLALSISGRGRLNDLVAKRNLALVQQAERLQAMPWDDLILISSGTTQMLIGDFVFNRRLTVTLATATRRKVTVTISPVTSEFVPDSVTIERTRPASGTPLCTTC